MAMTDLLEERFSLESCRGLALPGGFSFSDIFAAGKGWAGMIRFNPRLQAELGAFFAREDTFSLGVCNGAQLMTYLGVLSSSLDEATWPRLLENESGKFESRFVTLKINDSPAVMLRGMAGSQLGCIIASREGRWSFPRSREQAHPAMQYVETTAADQSSYPENPSGSRYGIAALCSADGRHLAMMPHMERLNHSAWQAVWPWYPSDWADLQVSPWMRPFQNAFEWCLTH